MDKEDLRILFAAFAMLKVTWNKGYEAEDAVDCWDIADAMVRAKDKQNEGGIATIKKRTRRSSND